MISIFLQTTAATKNQVQQPKTKKSGGQKTNGSKLQVKNVSNESTEVSESEDSTSKNNTTSSNNSEKQEITIEVLSGFNQNIPANVNTIIFHGHDVEELRTILTEYKGQLSNLQKIIIVEGSFGSVLLKYLSNFPNVTTIILKNTVSETAAELNKSIEKMKSNVQIEIEDEVTEGTKTINQFSINSENYFEIKKYASGNNLTITNCDEQMMSTLLKGYGSYLGNFASIRFEKCIIPVGLMREFNALGKKSTRRFTFSNCEYRNGGPRNFQQQIININCSFEDDSQTAMTELSNIMAQIFGGGMSGGAQQTQQTKKKDYATFIARIAEPSTRLAFEKILASYGSKGQQGMMSETVMKDMKKWEVALDMVEGLPSFRVPKITDNAKIKRKIKTVLLEIIGEFIVSNDAVKEEFVKYIFAAMESGSFGDAILLHGQPGTGKTVLGHALAGAIAFLSFYEDAFNKYRQQHGDKLSEEAVFDKLAPIMKEKAIKYYMDFFSLISLSGMEDVINFLGSNSAYVGAKHGALLGSLLRQEKFLQDKHCLAVRPTIVVLLDEIDKFETKYKQSNDRTILNLLDIGRESFKDTYLEEVTFNFRKILLIATANDITALSGPLKDRLRVLAISGYTIKDKIKIVMQKTAPNILKEKQLTNNLVFEESAVEVLVNLFGSTTPGLRNLAKVIEAVVADFQDKDMSGSLQIDAPKDSSGRYILNRDTIMEYVSPDLVQAYGNMDGIIKQELAKKSGRMITYCIDNKNNLVECQIMVALYSSNFRSSHQGIELIVEQEVLQKTPAQSFPAAIFCIINSMVVYRNYQSSLKSVMANQYLVLQLLTNFLPSQFPLLLTCATLAVLSKISNKPIDASLVPILNADNQGILHAVGNTVEIMNFAINNNDQIRGFVLAKCDAKNRKIYDEYGKKNNVQIIYVNTFDELAPVMLGQEDIKKTN